MVKRADVPWPPSALAPSKLGLGSSEVAWVRAQHTVNTEKSKNAVLLERPTHMHEFDDQISTLSESMLDRALTSP